MRRKPLPVLADPGYWMFLDSPIRAFLNIQHQVSSIGPENATVSNIFPMPVEAILCNVRVKNAPPYGSNRQFTCQIIGTGHPSFSAPKWVNIDTSGDLSITVTVHTK